LLNVAGEGDVRPIPSRHTVVELLRRVWSFVPSGGSLPENVWRGRRRFLVGLAWFHAAAIVLAGPLLGHRWELSLRALFAHETVLHTAAEGLVVAFFAALASWPRASRTFQATCVGFGLMSASGILVHLSGGYIEAHFHFFVMLAFLALCQDWIPYLLAVAFVAVHHGVVGVVWPKEVYNHPAAYESPWTWAAIHAAFVLASCVGSVIAWRFNERAFAQTAQILEAAGEGIFGVDTDGRVTFINPAAASMLGADVRHAVGAPIDRILRQLNADGTFMAVADFPIFAPLVDGRAREASAEMFARADGSYFPVDYVTTPMIERNHISGVVVSFNDITERQRAAAALQRSHRQLEETLAELKATQRQVLQQERLRAVGQMASGIAHDFNNTLSPIVGFSELLLRRPTGVSDTESYLRLINIAARDAAAVVRRLRDLYREKAVPAALAPVNLERCLTEAAALTAPRWRNQALATGVTIRMETAVDSVLPPIVGDEPELREMLTNLIFNAVDAMPGGGTIAVRARADGDGVRVEVADSGVGMSDEVRLRCLEPFFSTKGQAGSGLGLSLVNAIVERHGATLEIESRPGAGTTISVRFPPSARPEGLATGPEAEELPRRLRVLVVEDERVVRKVISEQLLVDSHTVETATNGIEGLEKFMSGWFDLVVTDRAMPEMGGDQLAATIARVAPGKPIIMLTGFGDLMEAKGERPLGVSVVVSKPVTGDTLHRAILEATADRAPRSRSDA
jgi:PAS domain S-box-containing protein